MSEKVGSPRYDFDFEPFETGLYTLKVKEVDIVKVDPKTDEDAKPSKGPQNDFNFVIHFQAEGGEWDQRSHFERFPHTAQGHIGLQKLQACMIKMEVMPPPSDPGGYDTSVFEGDKFKTAFKMKAPGRKIVAIIKRATSRRTGTEFSNIVSFYHVNEYKQAQEDFAKKYKKAEAKGKEAAPAAPLPGTEQHAPSAPESEW
jgi:hypothetical protein